MGESSSLSFFIMKKNLQKRLAFKMYEKQNRLLKMLTNNTLLDKSKRTPYAQKRHLLKKNSSITCIRNTCIETFRNRGVLTDYKLSRLQFKKYISNGFIPGIRKV